MATISKELTEMPGFEEGYIDSGDIKLHYVAAGTGKLILFVHGFPQYWQTWEQQLIEFGKDYRAVAYDTRGINLSSKPEAVEAYQMPNLIEDIKAVIEHFGGEKPILVAHDWGGAAAWYFALVYQSLIEKLVIINAPHPVIFARELLNNPEQEQASQYMLLFKQEGVEGAISADNFALLAGALWGEDSSRWKATPEERERYIEAWSQPGALSGGLAYYRSAILFPPSNASERKMIEGAYQPPSAKNTITIPTLVIWAEEDHALLPGNIEGLEAYVPNVTIRRIPKATHWVIQEQPATVNSFIREFLQT